MSRTSRDNGSSFRYAVRSKLNRSFTCTRSLGAIPFQHPPSKAACLSPTVMNSLLILAGLYRQVETETAACQDYCGPPLPSVIQERYRHVSGQDSSQWRRGRTCDVMHRSIKDCRGTRRCCKWHWRPPTPAPVLAIQSEDA